MSFFFFIHKCPRGTAQCVYTWYVVWYRYYSSTGLTRWCTRTMNAWDVWFRFVHVIFGIPFVQWYLYTRLGLCSLFLPVKSPHSTCTSTSTSTSTIDHRFLVLSTQYYSTSTSTFSTFDTCVCVCVCYCTYMKLHIHVYVCTTYRRATYLLASCTDMCAHNTAVQNIVTCYCYLLRQCKLFTEAVEVYTCTQRLPSTVPHTADAPLRLRIAHRLQF